MELGIIVEGVLKEIDRISAVKGKYESIIKVIEQTHKTEFYRPKTFVGHARYDGIVKIICVLCPFRNLENSIIGVVWYGPSCENTSEFISCVEYYKFDLCLGWRYLKAEGYPASDIDIITPGTMYSCSQKIT